MLCRITLFMFAACLLGTAAPADTIEIRGGGQVAGKVLRQDDDGKPPHVVIRLDGELSIALPKSRVNRITTSAELAEYRRHVIAAGDDPNKHYELAVWCQGNHLSRQSRYHMQRTIALEPDHSKARAALNYVKVKGSSEWILYAEQQRNRGLISVGGRWKLPEAVAMQRMQEKADKEAKLWIKQVARLRAGVMRGGAKAGESLEAIRGINDPLAATAIAEELKASRGNTAQSRQLRLEWVKLLGRIRNTTSVSALVLAGIDEPDNVVREAALEQLQQYGAASAVATYLPYLNPAKHSNKTVTKALRALSFFPDRELAMRYVEALVTSHKKEAAPGPGIAAGANNLGGGGLAMGGKKKVVIERFQNPGALTLLKMVEPGVDFRFDQQAWREYFASQLTAYQGDLRRDP